MCFQRTFPTSKKFPAGKFYARKKKRPLTIVNRPFLLLGHGMCEKKLNGIFEISFKDMGFGFTGEKGIF